MQTAHVLLSLGGDHGNQVMKWGATAAEIAVLRAIHGDESVTEVEPHSEVKRSHREERMRLLSIYGGAKIPDTKTPVVESMFPGAAARVFETLAELEIPESFYKATGRLSAPREIDPDAGPTIGEWVDAGYRAANYPPRGYDSKSTPEEIAAAVAAETPAPAPAPWKPADEESAPEHGDETDEGVGDDIDDEHAEEPSILG